MKIVSVKRYILTGMAPLLACVLASTAPAQTPEEREGARTAANEGREAFEAGDYERSIARFERANELIRAPTHTLYLARAHEKLGLLVLARELYREIDREQLAPDAPPPFVSAQQDARDELAALEKRIPRITVEVHGPGEESAKVTMNDEVVPLELVGIARPVDPGTHRFRANSRDGNARPVSVTIKEGENKTVTLELRSLNEPEDPAPPVPVAPDTSGGMHGMTIGGIASLGAGAVALGLGAYFTKQKGDRKNDADTLFNACNPRVCTNEERIRIDDMDDEATSNANKAMVGFIAGGVLVAGGVTLLLLAPSSQDSTSSASPLRPWIGIGSAGLSGTF
jgi:hypothetical protein